MPRLLIAASGTGGHIFPALAIAEALSKSWEINWLGVPDRLEVQLVPKKYELTTIALQGFSKGGLRKLIQLLRVISATYLVIRLIQRKRIQIVFTTGGYISAPAILAAKLCRKKVMLHESNAYPGKVTRLLGRFCDVVALGLPTAVEYLPNCQSVVTGTPVRKSFLISHDLPSWVPIGKGPLIVVIGGSQGAIGLNQMVRNTLPYLLENGCRVVHIIGKNEIQATPNQNLVEKTFTDEIPSLLQHADLVISRAGAGTLSELAVSSSPAILVPYPYATDAHQDLNAAYAAQFGGALIVHQHPPDMKGLTNALNRVLSERLTSSSQSSAFLSQMKIGMMNIAQKEAHNHVIDLLKKLTIGSLAS